MTILADEGVDRFIVAALRQNGYSVDYIAEISPALSDDGVLQRSVAAGALLVTQDKDFGDLVFRQGRAPNGILLLRLAGLPSSRKAGLVLFAIREHESELTGAFSVLSEHRLRIRRL